MIRPLDLIVGMWKKEEREIMLPHEYVRNAKKTDLSVVDYSNEASVRAANCIELLHACLGINTESGELTDIIKKYIMYGKPIDIVNFKEELGDLFWYIAIACDSLEVSFEEIFNQNIRKLKARYGEKFTKEAALNRDLAKERKELEDHIDNSNHYDIG